jgi:hypothetical protein
LEAELLFRRSLTLNILRTGWVRRSWDCAIGVRCVDSRHHGYGIGCEGNRIFGFFEGFESDDAENEICRAEKS